jgi:hypothetical protein
MYVTVTYLFKFMKNEITDPRMGSLNIKKPSSKQLQVSKAELRRLG